MMKGADGPVPKWPQPARIFTNGSLFNAISFFKVIHSVLNDIAQNGAMMGNEDLVLEHTAFFDLLSDRILILPDETVLFKTFGKLEMDPPVPSEFFVEHDNHRYLRLDCLRTPPNSAAPSGIVRTSSSESTFMSRVSGASSTSIVTGIQVTSSPPIYVDEDTDSAAAISTTSPFDIHDGVGQPTVATPGP